MKRISTAVRLPSRYINPFHRWPAGSIIPLIRIHFYVYHSWLWNEETLRLLSREIASFLRFTRNQT